MQSDLRLGGWLCIALPYSSRHSVQTCKSRGDGKSSLGVKGGLQGIPVMLRAQNILSMTISPTKAHFNMDTVGVKYPRLDWKKNGRYTFSVLIAPWKSRTDSEGPSSLVTLVSQTTNRGSAVWASCLTAISERWCLGIRNPAVVERKSSSMVTVIPVIVWRFRHVPFSFVSREKCYANRQQIIDFLFSIGRWRMEKYGNLY